MEISFLETKQILDTLPIGIYAGCRVETSLDKDADTSYYKLLEDEIVIAYNNVVESLKNLDQDSPYKETAVRSILYHELSHALMTPKDLKPTDIMNIFEDERIETLLKYYYHNVDFKKNVFYLNNFKGEKPKSAMDEFYQTVRYRIGEPIYLKQVNKIIDKYEYINGAHSPNDWYSYYDYDKSESTREYIRDVYDLYNSIAIKWNEPLKDPADCIYNGKSEGSGFLNDAAASESEGKNETKSMESMIEGAKNQQAGIMVNSPDTLVGRLSEKFYDPNLTENLERVLDNFNKKNSGGSSVCAYSGVFNYRNVTRKDYRYFDHKMSVNGSNTFGTFHLNLFLDDSGSMSNNESIVNKLLYSLIQVEKKNNNFTFDVFTCADRIEKCDKYKGYQARGGTHLRKSIIPLYREAQKPNTFNHNLILFDGYANTDKYLGGNTFKVFDNNSCTIISDSSNERNLKNNHNCKVIYSDHYTEELIDNVYKVLQAAFR